MEPARRVADLAGRNRLAAGERWDSAAPSCPGPAGAGPHRDFLDFFPRFDEEMMWGGQAFTSPRLLSSAPRPGRAVSPPADLPPLHGGQHSYDREMRLPDEPQTRIY